MSEPSIYTISIVLIAKSSLPFKQYQYQLLLCLFNLFGFARKKLRTKGSKGRILGSKNSFLHSLEILTCCQCFVHHQASFRAFLFNKAFVWSGFFTTFCKRLNSFSWLRRDLSPTITRFSHLSTLIGAYDVPPGLASRRSC